ncbi:MAG TPA: 3-phosphoserine/phosphohydroxythreonine transaminase [Labilithrix sp.]|nr:3-phosphoserine/phosphohydroxythreonine transaminase [Labilithrix sp.]
MTRAMNFNAGPAALPLSVLERAREEMLDFEGSGMSVMEHSHRGKTYERVHNEAISLLAELLGTPLDAWDILFVQGGASTAFAQIPLNFLGPNMTADFVVTGTWGEKAVAEARTVAALGGGQAKVAASTRGDDKSYVRVPQQQELDLTSGAAYVHVTSNETIHGVQWALGPETPFPKVTAPLVVDMSSDILGRCVDVSQFDLIYAGAQKNLGPSGVTVVAIKKEMIARGRKDIPTIFQYRTVAENRSLYNTPPTFGIYLVRSTLSWLKAEGGSVAMEARNRNKARALYEVIDRSGGFYRCPVQPAYRSIMNVVWRLPTPELEELFVKEAIQANMIGLKGHRATGGIRASIYNAVEPAWCDALASFMAEFARRRG